MYICERERERQKKTIFWSQLLLLLVKKILLDFIYKYDLTTRGEKNTVGSKFMFGFS